MSLGLIETMNRARQLAGTACHYPMPIPVDDNGQPDHETHAKAAVAWASALITEGVKAVKGGNNAGKEPPKKYRDHPTGAGL